jgi:nucleoside-diphosphate-sugar epimerase
VGQGPPLNSTRPVPLVLVTGATGFVGRHLIAELRARGHAVRAMVRRGSVFDLGPSVEICEVGNINRVHWPEALQGVDAIVHLAAVAHRGSPRDEAEARRVRSVNVAAVAELTAAAAALSVRRLILLSSIGVLGTDSGNSAFDGSSPAAPHDFYSQSKLDAERAAENAAVDSTLELCIIRPPLVYGPGAPGNFGRMIQWLAKGTPLPLGAIHNQRSLISVWNLCDCVIAFLSGPGAVGKPLVVADEETISTTELLRLCARLMERPARLLPAPVALLRLAGSILGRRVDIERLCGSLVVDTRDTYVRTGWRAPKTLQDELRRALTPRVTIA